jgi:hypothetical protein
MADDKRRSASVAESDEGSEQGDGDRPRRGGNRNGLRGVDAARRARQQLEELTGNEAVSVSALSKTDDGWTVRVEIVEVEKVPPTTNVMGSYEVNLDDEGDLVGYELVHRYYRGRVNEEAQ